MIPADSGASCESAEASTTEDAVTSGDDRPWLLELCPCEGGATKGYMDAGWRVVAVDTDEAALRRNPADEKILGDALEVLRDLISGLGVQTQVEARTIRKGGYVPPDPAVQSALLGGVDWMTFKGRRECIPPVYAHWIGRQLLAHVAKEMAA